MRGDAAGRAADRAFLVAAARARAEQLDCCEHCLDEAWERLAVLASRDPACWVTLPEVDPPALHRLRTALLDHDEAAVTRAIGPATRAVDSVSVRAGLARRVCAYEAAGRWPGLVAALALADLLAPSSQLLAIAVVQAATPPACRGNGAGFTAA